MSSNDTLLAMYAEAENVQHGLGEIVKGIWDEDVNGWKQFMENQTNNGTY